MTSALAAGLQAHSSDTVPAAPSPTVATPVKHRTVLIADDDDLVRTTYRNALANAGYDVQLAENGDQALSLLRAGKIWTLLVDIFMPERDGLEILMTAKRMSPGTFVVVMSGEGTKFNYLDAALKLGADEIMRKPTTTAAILEMLEKFDSLTPAEDGVDRRQFERLRTNLPGHLFNPEDWQTVECRVLNLSAGGALVQCDAAASLPDHPLVLYVEHFGRFEGAIAHRSPTLVGLKFRAGEAKRGRLKEMLASYAEHGTAGVETMRKFPRFKSDGSVTLTRASGREITCDVIDISPEGVSLRTREFPPVGEVVSVGKTRGRVVRHHDEGIALQFIR
jgi:CheY-like chemotaxis protein